MPLGVLKDTDSIINSSDRSVAETSSEFKPFISCVTAIDKTNTSLGIAEENISLCLTLKLQSPCSLVPNAGLKLQYYHCLSFCSCSAPLV